MFTDIFIRRPVLALVVSLLILLIGLRAMLGLPIRQYPKLSNTTITVTTIYPGASPNLMQGFITTPLAQAIATAEGVDYLTSSSVQGTSTITAYIQLDFDPDKALTEVMAKVQQVKYLIPSGAQDPVIVKATGQTTAVMYIGFSSDELASAGDLGLSGTGRPAAARHRARGRFGGYSRRPDLCDAVVARSGANGGARHFGERRVGGDTGQQLSIGAGPGERLLYGHQRQRRHRADGCPAIRGHGSQGQERRPRANARYRHGRSGGTELDLDRHDERPARRLHRYPGDAIG